MRAQGCSGEALTRLIPQARQSPELPLPRTREAPFGVDLGGPGLRAQCRSCFGGGDERRLLVSEL